MRDDAPEQLVQIRRRRPHGRGRPRRDGGRREQRRHPRRSCRRRACKHAKITQARFVEKRLIKSTTECLHESVDNPFPQAVWQVDPTHR